MFIFKSSAKKTRESFQFHSITEALHLLGRDLNVNLVAIINIKNVHEIY